jgi:diguanylate cyclase (GGDEF)-like protein
MHHETERRRVLIAAGPGVDYTLKQLFCKEALDGWETMWADNFSRARFLLQHDPCDLLLVNDDLYEREGSQGLAWLARQHETPLVFLAGSSALHFQKAYELGVHACLPRHMVLEQPALLATVMDRALETAEMRLGYKRAKDHLIESRQHVDRLVNMIWRTTSRQADVTWHSQRSMLERLQEELARAERHRVPLSLAVGEIQPAEVNESAGDTPTVPDWAMAMISRSKRRCDVVGQYGIGGFMLLMVHTPIKGGIQCCRRLQKFIEHAKERLAGPHTGLHAYFGVSSTMAGKMSASTLLRAAEQNLEAARADAGERMVAD